VSLRDEVELLLPNWERWYPSLFDAASDLGVIRARVCSPSSLLLSNRHAHVDSDAKKAHLENWGGAPEDIAHISDAPNRRRKRRKKKNNSQ
jgi:hypothetical protein